MELTRWQVDALFLLAEEAAPLECCGFISRDTIIPIVNVNDEPGLFRMEPTAQLQAMLYHEPIAVYHSHVSDHAVPSPMDRRYTVDGLFYLIVSLSDDLVNVFSDWQLIGSYSRHAS